jgi:lysophospholipase L1-like esterase
MRTTNICIFGDSIAYGAWDSLGGWVDRLRQFLHARTLASDFTDYYFVYHLAVPGNTTHDVLARLVPEIDAREPNVIISAVGINDSRYRDEDHTPHVAEDIFRVNVRTLIAETKERAPKAFFVGLTPVDETKTMPYEEGIYFENKNILRYNAILEEMTNETSVEFIEVYDALDAKEDLIDGLHPNARGHEKISIIIRDYLSEKGVII